MINFNSAIRTAIVTKLDLGVNITKKQIEIGLHPNINDCFAITTEFSDKLKSTFTIPLSFREQWGKDTVEISPICGSKMHGAYRDKGSVTSLMEDYIPFVDYKFNNEIEMNNFIKFLDDIDKSYIEIGNNTLSFTVDVIANPSTGRDNVGALVLDSCLQLESILTDTDIELTLEEIEDINIVEYASMRNHNHRVYFKNVLTGEVALECGNLPILLEDFFWQPKHDNRFYMKAKEIKAKYHQALDGMQALTPTLYDVIINTVNHESIKEDLVLLGMEVCDKGHESNKFSEENAVNSMNGVHGRIAELF